MNKRQQDILNYLSKNNQRWVTSGELAKFCGCTVRTIRNQVTKINETQQKIISSNQGYRLFNSVNNTEGNHLVEEGEVESRKTQLFLTILKSTEDGIDLYDFADSMFVSESAIRNDIQLLRQELQHKNLKLGINNKKIYLEGTERDRRRYMISLLYNEGDYQEKLKYHIQDMIGEISLNELEGTIRGILALHKIRINQYAMNNIVLHFAISISRIKQGNDINLVREVQLKEDSKEFQLSLEVTTILSKDYDIKFSNLEIQQLSLLFVGLQNEYLTNQKKIELSSFVEEKFIEVLIEVLAKIKETYLIDLQNEDFFNKLAIHIQNLYNRSKYEHFTRNNSLLNIKTTYPLTYDIAVYMSMLLQEKLDIWFNEDEISFIALHIGAYMESQKDTGEKISILVDFNSYHNFEDVNIQSLYNSLGDDIEITKASDNSINRESFDIYLTSSGKENNEKFEFVHVSPILTRKDIERVKNQVRVKRKNIWRKRMFILMEKFIIKDLYFDQFNPSKSTSKDIRKKLFNKMLSEKYVGKEFELTMEKRESMSSTGFPSGVAIPHSIEQNAKKSGVSVMTLQEPIIWNGYPIQLVALIAISQNESKEFNEFFETFIEIISDPINVRKLSLADGFDEFMLKLKIMVEVDD